MFQFEDSFFESELVGDFEVTSMMKHYWAADMEVLGEIDRICKKNNIKYFLYYGSLLGAVRHKGFIPWDDDVDIAMLRPDFNKFIKLFESERQEPFFISHADDTCLYPACVHNTHYMQIEENFMKQFHGCPYIAAVDIFVLDYVPTDVKVRNEYEKYYTVVNYVAQRLDKLWSKDRLPTVMHKHIDAPSEEDIEEVLSGIEQYSGRKFIRDDTLPKQMVDYCNEIKQKYSNGKKCDCIANVNDWAGRVANERMPRKYVEELIDIEFNGYKFPAPKYYDQVLKHLYGDDYMTPKYGGAAHDYPCYKEQAMKLETIFNSYNAPAPDYFYL